MQLKRIWVVQFHHPYFGWLEYDEHEFASAESAQNWMNCHPSPYRQRVQVIVPSK